MTITKSHRQPAKAHAGASACPAIIDAHCHLGKHPHDRESVHKYLQRADEAGISSAVLFATAFHPDYRIANREVADAVARHDDRFHGFAFVHPVRDRGRIRHMVREAVEELGLMGIKAHRRDGRITREICETAREFALPVVYDIMAEAWVADTLGRDYPDVRFIIPHMGSFQDDQAAQVALIDVLVRYDNIFTDTSGLRNFDVLESAIRKAGAHKVLFGSDAPWTHPRVELEKVFALGLGAYDEGRVLAGNALGIVAGAMSCV